MDLEIWIAFVTASIIIDLLPGPSMLLVIGHAMVQGTQKTVATVAGVVLADGMLLCLSLFGIGAVLYLSATAFVVMKWLGAGYLIYLGIRQWRQGHATTDNEDSVGRGLTRIDMFIHGFVTTLLNPKIIGFFIAFFPQFVLPDVSLLLQLSVLGFTFLVLVFLIMMGYVFLAAQVRSWFKSPRAMVVMNRVSGITLMGAGLMTAALKRN